MCCGTKYHHKNCHCGSHGSKHHHTSSCACGGSAHFQRRFLTKEERIARLEQYRDRLQKETQAVDEQIAALQES